MMEIAQLGNNHMTVCSCCDVLIHNRIGWEECRQQLGAHLTLSSKCKAYYNNLPGFSDIIGIAPNATGDLSSEEFVRKLRSGDDE